MINFEWDDAKAASNFKKHRVTFDEAVTVFGDSLAITFPDTDRKDGEYRSGTCGRLSSNRLLVAVHTERRNNVRIISARKATKYEKNICEKD